MYYSFSLLQQFLFLPSNGPIYIWEFRYLNITAGEIITNREVQSRCSCILFPTCLQNRRFPRSRPRQVSIENLPTYMPKTRKTFFNNVAFFIIYTAYIVTHCSLRCLIFYEVDLFVNLKSNMNSSIFHSSVSIVFHGRFHENLRDNVICIFITRPCVPRSTIASRSKAEISALRKGKPQKLH